MGIIRNRTRHMKVAWLAVAASLCIMLGVLLTGCGSTDAGDASAGGEEPVSRDFFAMDTYMTVVAYGDRAAEATEAAEEEVGRLDAMLSTGNAGSEISELNDKGRAVLSPEAGALVKRGLEMYDRTEGCFDIAIYPIMKAWGFTDQKYRVPTDAELEELLPLTNADEVLCRDVDGAANEDPSADNSTADEDASADQAASDEGAADVPGVEVSFEREGMAIDLGGIAKGYTSSRIMDIYRDCGVTSGMVSLGGNVQVLGTKPDGSNWRVAVQDPGEDEAATDDDSAGEAGNSADGDGDSAGEDQSEETAADPASGEEDAPKYLGVLEASDTAIITSGAYERNFTQDGKLYHHIIDPATGKPADSGLRSVTIVSEDGTLADALSTSLYIMGKDKAIDYWRDHADEFNFILMDEEDELFVSEPIAEQFSSDAYRITVVE